MLASVLPAVRKRGEKGSPRREVCAGDRTWRRREMAPPARAAELLVREELRRSRGRVQALRWYRCSSWCGEWACSLIQKR